ncbi:T9SS type A sorting domain-containing protein [Flavivirga spongiicola]|uniref:T9SS type A sorting domain-containing protein n=1 Tax=Flavivirga spongiicola TaxID=421621 RepID=A0ABU7XWQ8_9FLAO|nr:T9SS type A sorting domain-containing protein [Flavivirga sp. MEBiC05379]MDO5979396.1 T9SS type A sorting domain-containing protein [Flavivirga sp. MEBiC05379]
MKNNTLTLLFFLMTTIVFSQSKLIFSYDSASNQVERKYCEDGSCNTAKSVNKKETVSQEEEIIVNEEFDNSLAIFPNPTKGLLTIKWDQDYSHAINEIALIDLTSKIHRINYTLGNHEANIDLSSWPIGLYIVRFFLKDGTTLTKKIIKK